MAAATLLAAVQKPAAAKGSASANSSGDISEIVVTARRREESSLETPLAITAGAGRSDRSFQRITLRGMVHGPFASKYSANLSAQYGTPISA